MLPTRNGTNDDQNTPAIINKADVIVLARLQNENQQQLTPSPSTSSRSSVRQEQLNTPQQIKFKNNQNQFLLRTPVPSSSTGEKYGHSKPPKYPDCFKIADLTCSASKKANDYKDKEGPSVASQLTSSLKRRRNPFEPLLIDSKGRRNTTIIKEKSTFFVKKNLVIKTRSKNIRHFTTDFVEEACDQESSIEIGTPVHSIKMRSQQHEPMDVEASTSSSEEIEWRFSQIKGTLDSEETPAEADLISCIEFSHDGELLATGDKGGRVVIFQRDQNNKFINGYRSTDYNVYSTFQSHEPEFDYLKSLEIEEKINKVRWLKKKNAANFLLSTNDKTIKLWKISERERRVGEGYWNTRTDGDNEQKPAAQNPITALKVPKLVPMQLVIEASPRRVYSNAHTYHINSISVNSDQETYISADDLRINLWHLEITSQSFNIVDIKPTNMEELTEVITAAEFHPSQCNIFVYSSSKGSLRMCDMRQQALCDLNATTYEEPEDLSSRSFFSEIISSISDVKFSHKGDYLLTRDYLTVKVWDIRKSNAPVESYNVHEYLRGKLCSLYENDCIFDKFECAWSGDDKHVITGSYNNFFRTFNRSTANDQTLEACPDVTKSRQVLKSKKIGIGGSSSAQQALKKGRRDADTISADSLDFNRKILHTAWHPNENIIAVAATNNLYIFQDR